MCINRSVIAAQWFHAGKPVQASFNLSHLPPVKVVFQRPDDILDIAGNAAKLSDGLAGRAVAAVSFSKAAKAAPEDGNQHPQ